MKKLAYLSLLSHCTVALKHASLRPISEASRALEKNLEWQLANPQTPPLWDSNYSLLSSLGGILKSLLDRLDTLYNNS